jgi:putative DNA primase/helicase
MIAAVQDAAGAPVALHRTWLRPDGLSKADLDSPRKSLNSVTGHAIHLAPIGPAIVVAEGIETTLAAMSIFGRPGLSTISSSGLAALQLPEGVEDLLICADSDKAGIAAADSLFARLRGNGLAVRVVMPAVPGSDFADVVVERDA